MAVDSELLEALAHMGALHRTLHSNTSHVASALCISQQSASRRLRALAKSGMVLLAATPRGCSISIAAQGRRELMLRFSRLGEAFGHGKGSELHGTVFSGMGEGRYYVSLPRYRRGLSRLLRAEPYLGTLNMHVDDALLHEFTAAIPVHMVQGFSTKERTFGALRCYIVRINNSVDGMLVMPERSTYPAGVVEAVSGHYLRGKFGLKDGDAVTIAPIGIAKGGDY